MLIEQVVPGSTWGKWTVVSNPFKEGKHYHVHTKCECGSEGKPRAYALLNGSSAQCVGCRRVAQADGLRIPGSGWNTYYYRYEKNAERRSLPFGLSKEEFMAICIQDCDYCGEPPVDMFVSPSQEIAANGVDRVDSAYGYSLSNCVPCCSSCNRMKMDISRDKFLTLVAKIAKKHELKK